MQWALNDKGERISAEPNASALCPICHKEVIAKCGDINIWHWAHKELVDCDAYREAETDWHRNWRYYIQDGSYEVIMENKGVRRIADIVGNSGIVIEASPCW